MLKHADMDAMEVMAVDEPLLRLFTDWLQVGVGVCVGVGVYVRVWVWVWVWVCSVYVCGCA